VKQALVTFTQALLLVGTFAPSQTLDEAVLSALHHVH
jgi:hypothetical protein